MISLPPGGGKVPPKGADEGAAASRTASPSFVTASGRATFPLKGGKALIYPSGVSSTSRATSSSIFMPREALTRMVLSGLTISGRTALASALSLQ